MANVKMFVKPDRYPTDVCAEKDPRAIQYRSMEFNLLWASYLMPLEHWAYENLRLGVSQTKIIAKGLNPYQRASIILEKNQYFTDPIYLLVDHSRFDSTINVTHLKCTHSIYKKSYKGKIFHELAISQLHNKGISKHGIKYSVKGTRMSGDFDTGLGNCLVNIICLTGILYDSNIKKFDLIVDGDDSIIFIERCDLSLFRRELFEDYGFDTKFDYTDNLHKAEFCQSRLILSDPPVMVRNPRRAWSHANATLKQYTGKRLKELFAGIGVCELSLNQGVPVMQKFGYDYSQFYHKYHFDDELAFKMAGAAIKFTQVPITKLARQSFEEAWQIPEWLQLKMEKRNWTANAYNSYLARKKFSINQYVRTVETIRRSRSSFCTLDTDSGPGWWAIGS